MGTSEKSKKKPGNSQNAANIKNTKISKQNGNSADRTIDIITAVDKFFSRYSFLVFIISLFLSIILGILLFDLKISEGGDDSDYILSAKKFLDHNQFPFWHGSFYPIFLGIIMLVFGFNVVIFKIFSFIFIILHLTFFYLALRNRVPAVFLCLVTIFTAVNANILYYASQTYSEAIYMFLQAVLIYVFLLINDNLDNRPYKIKEHWKLWLLFGFLTLLISTTRTVGYSMLMAVVLYLLINRRYRASLYALASYLVFLIPYTIYKWIAWDLVPGKSGGGRFEIIFYKNAYSKAAGTEDLAGMITRFIENSRIYLSKHFLIITGLKDPASTEMSAFLTVLMYSLFLIAFIYAFKKSRTLLFIALYLAFSIGITFITLQQSWGQQRLILVYVPMILILFLWGIYAFINSINRQLLMLPLLLFIGASQFLADYSAFVKGLVIIICVILIFILVYNKKAIPGIKVFLHLSLIILFLVILFKTAGYTSDMIKLHKKEFSKNLRGNLYYGFTPDWINFLKMSEFVGREYHDKYVASRKPSMSFIYSKGKEFYPIYKVPIENADTLIQNLRQKYKDLCFIDNNEFSRKKVPGIIRMNFKKVILAFVGKENITYGVYEVNDNYKEEFYNTLKNYNVNYIPEADTFLFKICRGSCYGVYPDTLIHKLKKNNVDYVIMANLRVNPKQRTNRTVNAVRRYIYYIELKYPGTFTEVTAIPPRIKGEKPEDHQQKEPAYLLRINYNRYNMGN
jgi:hypothetical protein